MAELGKSFHPPRLNNDLGGKQTKNFAPNAITTDRIRQLCAACGFPAPVICTPYEQNQFLGKPGSALTSRICLLWRSLWAAMKSTHS